MSITFTTQEKLKHLFGLPVIVVAMTFLYETFKEANLGIILSGSLLGLIVFAIGIYATLTIPETHGRDLDFIDE